MKKIAVCITGLDRSLSFCLNSLKENLINCNDYEFHIIGLVTSKDIKLIENSFNLLKLNSDQPLPNLVYQQSHYYALKDQHIQCYYQLKDLYEVNKLRIQYEVENNIEFDYIIRYRTDFNLLSKVNLADLKNNIIYIPIMHDHTGYNDRFAVGDRNVMNTYFNRYEFWMKENNHIQNYNTHAENNLKIYLDQSNIKVDRLYFDYALRRNYKYHPWIKEVYGIDEINISCVVNGNDIADGYLDNINKKIFKPTNNQKMLPVYSTLPEVEEYTKQWANRYMCKWSISETDAMNDIIDSIQNDKPLSYTRFCDGELILLKEYFNRIKNDPYYINLCNANHHIPHVSEYNSFSNNIEIHAQRFHDKNMYDNYMFNRWGIYDDITQKNIIRTIGESLIKGLQTSTHIGIWQPELKHIGDYYIFAHAHTPHVELFAAAGTNFSRLTSAYIHLEESLANPYKFKEILNGKPIHIFTSNENELKNVTKLHEILETEISYTNITPVKRDWKTHSFAFHDFLNERSKEIKEQIVLYGLGYGAKHLPGYLSTKYGKTVIDVGANLDAWAGKITRPHMKEKSYMLTAPKENLTESFPWDPNNLNY